MSDVLNHLALPWFVLVVAYMGEYSLIMRNSLIDVMNDDFRHDGPGQGGP